MNDTELTIAQVARSLRRFLRQREVVLICFPSEIYGDLGTVFEQAVRDCGGFPKVWGPDQKWKTLLRQAFSTRATTIIAPPRVLLGLCKAARSTATPLFILNAITAAHPCTPWMQEVISRGMDCKIRDHFDLGRPEETADATLVELEAYLQTWSSVLDCRMEKTPHGLDLELVVFPGEKLPTMPTCAKRIIRPWVPEQDAPMGYGHCWENPNYAAESH